MESPSPCPSGNAGLRHNFLQFRGPRVNSKAITCLDVEIIDTLHDLIIVINNTNDVQIDIYQAEPCQCRLKALSEDYLIRLLSSSCQSKSNPRQQPATRLTEHCERVFRDQTFTNCWSVFLVFLFHDFLQSACMTSQRFASRHVFVLVTNPSSIRPIVEK